MLDRLFQIEKSGSTVTREVIGGVVTFMTMAYIISTQPFFMNKFAPDWVPIGGETYYSIMVATCLLSAFATLVMALGANYPVALAPGMGENILFATMIGSVAATPQQAIGVIFVSGAAFFILALLRVREKIISLISASLKSSIAVAIGAFILVLGLLQCFAYPASFDLLNWRFDFAFDAKVFLVFVVNLAIIGGLYLLRVQGSLLIGMVLAVVVSSMFGLLTVEQITGPVPSLAPTFLQIDIIGAFSLTMIPYIFIFLFMDVFDTLGTLIGVTQKAGLTRPDGSLPRIKSALMADAVGTVGGSLFGISTVTSFIESSAGVAVGARTGLASVVTALLFLLAIFFTPLWAGISAHFVIGPALVVVGLLMMTELRKIDWKDWTEAAPAFLTIAAMVALTAVHYGLAAGFISYPVCKLLGGRTKDITWLNWALALICLVMVVVLIVAK